MICPGGCLSLCDPTALNLFKFNFIYSHGIFVHPCSLKTKYCKRNIHISVFCSIASTSRFNSYTNKKLSL